MTEESPILFYSRFLICFIVLFWMFRVTAGTSDTEFQFPVTETDEFQQWIEVIEDRIACTPWGLFHIEQGLQLVGAYGLHSSDYPYYYPNGPIGFPVYNI